MMIFFSISSLFFFFQISATVRKIFAMQKPFRQQQQQQQQQHHQQHQQQHQQERFSAGAVMIVR